MGYKQKKDTPPMERELNYLLADLCVNWGFCIPPDSQSEISKQNSYSSVDFAIDVLKAEGMNSAYENKWINRISERFIERFGQNQIEVSSFSDRIRGEKENWRLLI